MSENRESWSGQIMFVIAAAASAIGLGNLWRFPYLAAQYGGGAFILVYIALVATMGIALMTTEIAIGRMTRESQLTAYGRLDRRWRGCGILSTAIALVILPYYSVVGGWVLKYLLVYARAAFTGTEAVGGDSAGFFNAFIGASFAPFGYGALFIITAAFVVSLGVQDGIEKSNLVLMPLLLVIAFALAVYVLTLPGALAGVRYYLCPSASAFADPDGGFSWMRLMRMTMGAMGQMFYSGSLAMGIMITYGSYMRREDSVVRSVLRIEFFDTLIALLAGFMIVPVVYLFAVQEGMPVETAMNAGPGLMFITLPKVFATFGASGVWVGLLFFALVLFAALTSAISLYEAGVAAFVDSLRVSRGVSVAFVGTLSLLLSVFSALGFGVWGDIRICGQTFLDFFDFITNSVLMPVAAMLTCVFVGWRLGVGRIVGEVEREGRRLPMKAAYAFFIRYLAPLILLAILVSQVMAFLHDSFGIGSWHI